MQDLCRNPALNSPQNSESFNTSTVSTSATCVHILLVPCAMSYTPGGAEKSRRVPDAARPCRESAGDAHAVVVGRAYVHQVGGRVQPVPAAATSPGLCAFCANLTRKPLNTSPSLYVQYVLAANIHSPYVLFILYARKFAEYVLYRACGTYSTCSKKPGKSGCSGNREAVACGHAH